MQYRIYTAIQNSQINAGREGNCKMIWEAVNIVRDFFIRTGISEDIADF